MSNDFVSYRWCLYPCKGDAEMSQFALNLVVNNVSVSVEFDWYGDEPCWDTTNVIALLPGVVSPEGKHWVKINDVLSDDDWHRIEAQIYERQDELYKQAVENEY